MKTAQEVIELFEDEVAPENFLPAVLIMIDLEMSGVVPERDDILQIAMLKLVLKNGRQYEAEGQPLEIFMHSEKTPSNAFHREFLPEIFAKANASDIDPVKAKQMIVDWLGDLKGLATPTGDAIQQDMAFLYAKGVIDRGDIVNDQNVPGTFHYEVFDLNAVKCIARQKMGSREDLELESNVHDATVDCRNQTIELNAYLDVLIT